MYVCTSCNVVSLSTTDVIFNTPPLTWVANFDARLVSETEKYRSTNKLRKHVCQLILVQTIQSVQAWSTASRPIHGVEAIMARVLSQPGPDTTCIRSFCHRAFMGCFKSSRQVRHQSVFTKFRAAYGHCFASCHCCHDPFIAKSAQTRPPFTGFTQLAHPSQCSRSTLTTVCFCARVSGSAAPSPDPSSARHRHLVVECGIHGE